MNGLHQISYLKKRSRNSSDGEVRKHYLRKALRNQKFGKQLIKLCFTLSQALEQILHIPQKSQIYISYDYIYS